MIEHATIIERTQIQLARLTLVSIIVADFLLIVIAAILLA